MTLSTANRKNKTNGTLQKKHAQYSHLIHSLNNPLCIFSTLHGAK